MLTRAGVEFDVVPADIDERPRANEPAIDYAVRVAGEKADLVAGLHDDAWVLAADTVVIVDGEILGKAEDAADAARMLARLQGRTHSVTTAVWLLGPGAAEGRVRESLVVSTEVVMTALDAATVRTYVATGEWRGKAGAYAAQGLAAAFITELRGSYTNVVGLPLAEVLLLLARTGAPGADFARGTAA